MRKQVESAIDTRTFQYVKYQGLDSHNSSSDYHGQIHVYHVAKEFGPASMGGLGMVVTALAVAQQKERHAVNVVLPYYSFLDEQRDIDIVYHTTLSIDIRDESQELQQVSFQVHSFQYFEAYDAHALTPVTVWLIGSGDMRPFDAVFDLQDARKIYFPSKALPNEWRDLFFCKAVARFLLSQNNRSSGAGLPTPYPVDVIHLHGASNALVSHFLQRTHRSRHSAEKQPAMIYTLHDYLYELLYSYDMASFNKFEDGICHVNGTKNSSSHTADISKYYHDDHGLLFTSSLGIDLAHASTFVSKTMTKDIVEGRLDFYLKELVLDSILDQAEKNLFIGITNGIDISRLNPWTNPALCQDQLAYPSQAFIGSGCASNNILCDEKTWDGARADIELSNPTIRSAKEAAKRYLVSQGFLKEQDIHRPLVLFIGRFQHNKGLEFFETACSAIKVGGGKFVIMGQPNVYPVEAMYELRSQFNGTVEIIADDQGQRKWGIYLRAAADFLFVPSLTESFGLVAAEGLLFGSIVISSGVGGLTEFLVDKPLASRARQQNRLDSSLPKRPNATVQQNDYNSYFFDAFASDAHSQLSTAFDLALRDWRDFKRNPIPHEAFLTKLLESALAMTWDRPGGPVAEYRALYKIALTRAKTIRS
ncbi:hypothetical protein BGZ68_007147 [Mortierella alpina]|nr:hypothetical protein BGZ68_007147 [Mortierella alpina]